LGASGPMTDTCLQESVWDEDKSDMGELPVEAEGAADPLTFHQGK